MTTVHRPIRGEDLGGAAALDWLESLIAQLAAQIADLTAGTGNMRNEDNLAFLLNFATARFNLDVPSFGEVDTRIADAIATVLVGAGAVTSVNGDTGDIILTFTDVGADVLGAAAQALVDAKAYADTIAAGFQPRAACAVATAAALPTCTYNNGTAGVGATLIANANGALTVDTIVVAVGDRILVKDQASAFQNGIYVVTAPLGDASNPFVLTRATDADASAEVPAGMVTFITNGTAPRKAGTFVQLTTGPITVGTTAQVFAQSNAAASYTFSNGLVLAAGNVAPTFGTGANTFTQGNDSRLSDARTPTAHKVAHQLGGTDELALAESQVTNLTSDLAGKLASTANLSDVANAATARTNLGLHGAAVLDVGTTAGTVAAGDDIRFGAAADTELSAIAALTSATDTLPYFTGSGTAALAAFTAAGRALVDDTTAAAQRTTLGLAIGTNVQAWDTDLDALAAQANTALGRSRLAATRSTFSDANYTVLATDTHVDQIGTLTASRTVTLPAASAVPAGWKVTIANQSATTPTLAIFLTIQRAGSDTLVNEGDVANTTNIVMGSPKGSYAFVSDGVSKWDVVSHGLQRPYLFWSGRAIAVPDGVWTPQPWNVPTDDPFNMSPGLHTLTTTVAAASDGLTLPTTTITVASTSGFPGTGFLAITGPPQVVTGVTSTVSTDIFTKTAHAFNSGQRVKVNGLTNTTGLSNLTQYFVRDATANTFKLTTTFNGTAINLTGADDTGLVVWMDSIDTVVGYTGTTGTTFTGCNAAGAGTIIPPALSSTTADFSTGTLKTGMLVTGANCRFTCHTPYLYAASAYAEFVANDTGVRNIKWQDGGALFLAVTRGNETPATGTSQMVGMTTQPGITLSQYSFVSVYQSSGGVLFTQTEGITAPLLMMVQVASA